MPSEPQLAAQASGVGASPSSSPKEHPLSIALSRSSIRYGAVTLAVIAALALAGCGSASSSSRSVAASVTTSTSNTVYSPSSTTATSIDALGRTSPSGGVTSRDGHFVAVIPAGFRNATESAQGGPFNILYLAMGPRAGAFTSNINVVRGSSAGLTDIDAIVRDELRGIKRLLPDARPISSPEPVTVGGEPARELDYAHGPTTQLLHVRQVIVEHRGWIYVITYTASSTTYAAGRPSLAEVISSWRWTS